MTPSKPLNYRDAGVDIDAGNALIERIKPLAGLTARPELLGGLGGFGGLFDLSRSRYREPVLVSGADGAGTKPQLAQQCDRHDTIGVDLVAMCVNDVLCQGAEPLFFLDYFVCGRLEVDTAATVIRGIAEGCRQAGCALAGGETAEHPGMYGPGEYDLAGFCVGIAEKSRLLDGSRVRAGDALIGLAASGPHANGYSLIRKLIARDRADLNQVMGETTLGEALLAPTRIYVKPVLDLLERFPIAAVAHITGGGLWENITRVVPENLAIELKKGAWPEPDIFHWLRQHSGLGDQEMLRTFNCGVGMVLAAPAAQVDNIARALDEHAIQAWAIGQVIQAPPGASRVFLN